MKVIVDQKLPDRPLVAYLNTRPAKAIEEYKDRFKRVPKAVYYNEPSTYILWEA